MALPFVSYVLVNWRTEELLPRALESIAQQDYPFTEVFLVDNGSPDFSEAEFTQYCPFTLIRNEANLGFARANNQAIERCRGDLIVLLNCDAYLDRDFTRRAAGVFAANPRIGTVVPKILNDDLSGRIDSTGHIMHRDRTPAHRGKDEMDQGQYGRGGFVFGGTAAAVMYRREMLETIAEGVGPEGELLGVFDESFFAYYEDVDLDWRAQLCGWQAYYEPACVAYHRGHGSGGRRSVRIQLIAEKNRYLMLAKNDTLAGQLSAIGSLTLYEGWHFLKTLLKPWLWPAYFLLLINLPRAWAYRLKAGSKRRVPPGQVAGMFTHRGVSIPPRADPPEAEAGPVLETDAERARSDEPGNEDYFPLVSVVILNLNGLRLTKQCLAALRRQSYEPLEIIVVDNGSDVDEADLLKVSFPEIIPLRLKRNTGFSGGVNWGVSMARGEYIILLNNDCILDSEAVKRLVYAAKRSRAEAVSGRLVDIEDESQVGLALHAVEMEDEQKLGEQVVGELPLSLANALFESNRNHGLSLFGYIVHDAYRTDECFYPSGGLCVLSRRAIETMLPELLPARYFAYHEDAYLGFRLRVRGGRVLKEPRAVGVHIAGSTARSLGRPRLRYLMERNRCLNLAAFLPAGVWWKLLPFNVFQGLLSALLLMFTRPLDLLGWIYARLWALAHPFSILRWRAKCRGEAMVPDHLWLSELSGRLRGKSGILNMFSLGWARMMGITCRETTVKRDDK